MRARLLQCAIAGLVALGAVADAAASLIFEIDRISDNVAEISASGTVDVNTSSATRFALNGATSVGNLGLADSFTGTLMVGNDAVSEVFVRAFTTNLVLGFPTALAIGDVASGSVRATLDVETFNAFGTVGNVTIDGNPSVVLGTYSIATASVPEPATLALIGSGLAGIGFARRRARSTY